MKTAEFLTHLRDLGVILHLEEGRLICNAPKGVLTPDMRVDLKTRKADIIDFLAQGQAATGTTKSIVSIEAVPRNGRLPLTLGQERLWILNQLEPDSPVYNVPFAFRLQGDLDKAALKRSLNEIVKRHEVLRTTFKKEGDTPIQVIAPILKLDLPLVDLQDWPVVDREKALAQYLKKQAAQPFDMEQGPLVRVALICLTSTEYVLFVMFNHAIFDGWSRDVFVRELSALYRAFNRGQAPSLPELPIQYADYAVWQRRWMDSEQMEQQLAYWQKQLADKPPMLQLPSNLPQRPVQSYQGAHESITLPKSLTLAQKRLNRQEKTTLFVTLLTAFKVFLHQYTGQEELLVCTPVAGRELSEAEHLLGYFNNIIVLRSSLSDNPSFSQLLLRVRQTVLEAYNYQNLPFQKVAELPHLTSTPLARALFVLEDALEQAIDLPGLSVSPVAVEREIADFDLSLAIAEKEGKLVCMLWYKTDLFSQAAVAQMLKDFQTLLECIVADPNQPLSALPTFGTPKTIRTGQQVVSTNEKTPSQDPSIPDHPETAGGYLAPRDNLEIQLTRIWENVFEYQPIGVRDNFFDLGGHSLLAVHLFAEIKKQLMGQELPLAILFQTPTIEQLAEVLRTEGWSSSWSALVPIQPNGSHPPLFFAHAHGGNVIGYYDLAYHLGLEQPLYGLQAQGLDGTSSPFCRFEDIVAHYIKEIRTVQPHGPYYLGGWCFGGYVALEMARHLQAEGEEVALVVMIESPHPDYPKYLPGTGPLRRHFYRVSNRLDLEISNFLEVEYGRKLAYSSKRISRLVNTMRLKFEGLSHTPGETSPASCDASQIQIQKAVEQAHAEAYYAYKPKSYEGTVAVFRAAKQPLGIYPDPTLGWGELIKSELDLQEAPGHHIGLLSEPRVRITADKIRKCLDKAQQSKVGCGPNPHIPGDTFDANARL